MEDPLSIIGGVVIVLAVGASFVLSLSEASLLAVPEVSLRRLVDQGSRRALALQRLKSSDDYLSAIIVGINACLILVSTLVTVLVHRSADGPGALPEHVWHIATIACILILAEVTPKTWGTMAPERVALAVTPLIQCLVVITAPVVRVITTIANVVLRAVGTPAVHRRHFITATEIQAAADIGEEEGMIEPEEGEMLDSVIALQETTAARIMTPRVDIIAVSEDATVEEFVALAVESGYSRIPLYADTLDTITGILYVTDVLKELGAGHRDVDLASLARPPVFVPESKRLSELFGELRDASVHIAIVLDEFGGTEGLTTIEDILEELVGEIEDEHDAPDHGIVKVSEDEAVVDGKARIEDVNQELDLELPDEDSDTIAGLVSAATGRIPGVGESVSVGHANLTIEQGTDQHVERVRITKTDSQGDEA